MFILFKDLSTRRNIEQIPLAPWDHVSPHVDSIDMESISVDSVDGKRDSTSTESLLNLNMNLNLNMSQIKK